jgi:transmembrane sensor
MLRDTPEAKAWVASARRRPAARASMLRALGAALFLFAILAGSPFAYKVFFDRVERAELIGAGLAPRWVTLPDGSEAILDTDARAHGVFSRNARLVVIERGHASFRVARHAGRPFQVTVPGGELTTANAAFDVRASEQAVDVSVISGALKVGPARALQLAQAGSHARLCAGEVKIWAVDLLREAAWASGRHLFVGQTIGQAASEINRYSDRKVIVDPPLAGYPINGVFKFGDSIGFAHAAADLYGANVTMRDPHAVVLAKHP